MAVTSMKLVNITGKLGSLDNVLEQCTSGCDFHFEQAMSFFGSKSDFAPINDENPYAPIYTKLNGALTEARLTPLSQEECADAPIPASWNETVSYIDSFIEKLHEKAGRRSEIEKQIEKLSDDLEHLRHFTDLDISLSDIFECEYIKVRFGRLPKESYNRLGYYSDNPYIMLMPCESDSKYVWGVYFAPIESVPEVDRIFQSLMWERLHLPDATGTPSQECVLMAQRITELATQGEEASAAAAQIWEEHKVECSRLLHLLKRRKDSFELRRYVARYKEGDQFFLAGWITAADAKQFEQQISSIPGVECEIEKPDAAEGHSPPVKLKNRGPIKPFEFFVSMYGLPQYGEIDPTPFVAITYFLLFGMMFADVGQGIVLSLIGWLFMWKMKKMELGRIMGICGFSSVIFGVLLGSVFGFEHWLDGFWGWVHEKTGVPLNEGKLINIEDSQVVNALIYATIGIGAALVMCAMMLNIYACLRQRKWGAALFSQNGVAGLVFYGSVVYAVVNALLLGGSLPGTVYILLLIVLPLLLIMCCEPLSELLAGEKHWLPENIGDFLSSSIFEMFEVILSYVSNTVSFLRVGAFILVHYGMMTVVFTIAGFCEPGSVGYIIVLILGNGLIIALEALLSGIQALRLEFYEMFSRFYSGSGQPFVPASSAVDTK